MSRETQVLLDLKPSGDHYMEDFHRAGGMATLLRELKPLLHLGAMTVTGRTLGEEIEAARRIPLPLDALALQPLIDIQERHDAAVSAGEPRAVFRANLDFHQRLFSLAGNEVLTQAIQEYARRTHAIRFSTLVSPDYRERAQGEHWQMIHALRDGHRDTLVSLCRRHLLPSRDAYLQAHPDTLG
jgi:DNA-binding GntR family transcriptional regulator